MAERARLAGLRKDGATLPVEISLSPVPTASETFVLAVIRDATEPGRRNDLPTWPTGRRPISRGSPGTCSTGWCTACSRSG